MDDPLGKHRKDMERLSEQAEQLRRISDPTKFMREALDSLNGGIGMRFMQDMMANAGLQRAFSPQSSFLETMRTLELAEAPGRRIFGISNMSLKSMLDLFGAHPSWLSRTLSITQPSWIKDVASMPFLSNPKWMLDDKITSALSSAGVLGQNSENLRAINDILRPALATNHPVTATLERLGLGAASKLRDLYEPAWLRMAHDTLSRIQAEQAAFANALPKIASPWAGIDWDRMRRIVEQATEYAKLAADSVEEHDAWEVDAIPDEEQAEFAAAMGPVVQAIEEAKTTPDRREEKQAEAIARILEYCEQIVAKQDEQDRRLSGHDADLARKKRSRLVGWIVHILIFLTHTGWDLSKEWAASHTTPAINQTLGLLSEPVSSAKHSSAIRRDAADSISGIEVAVQDVRYLRVVIRRALPVYERPESIAAHIHRLQSGQIVAIVKWNKKWRLVEWYDLGSGEFVSGWVRAKYIAKIRS